LHIVHAALMSAAPDTRREGESVEMTRRRGARVVPKRVTIDFSSVEKRLLGPKVSVGL
jgi:hypothetical protein